MITAHLPAGYIAARTFAPEMRHAVPIALVASALPDLDFFYLAYVDNYQFNHHKYWVHIPFFWMVVGLAGYPLARAYGWARHWMFFLGVIFLHLLLDSFVGGIMWAAPFSDTLFSLTKVPANGQHWVLRNMLHWTFLAEIAIWVWAGMLVLRERRLA